jgi:hypothetical protein
MIGRRVSGGLVSAALLWPLTPNLGTPHIILTSAGATEHTAKTGKSLSG